MRKRLPITTMVLGLGVILTVDASPVFFTNKEEAYSVVTMSNIDTRLNEEVSTSGVGEVWKVAQETEDGTTVGLEYTSILPGATLEKEAEIPDVGTNPAYIREKITVAVTGRDGEKLSAGGLEFWRSDYSGNQTKISAWGDMEDADASTREESITDDKTVTDCITIYGDKTLENTESIYLFNHIGVPISQGNVYAGASIEIQPTVEAIQSDFIEVPEIIKHAPDKVWSAFLNFREYLKKM